MKQRKTGIFWFTNDLRLHDNSALVQASAVVDELLCIYIKDQEWHSSNHYSCATAFKKSDVFLRESLDCLNLSLKSLGQRLVVMQADTVSTISQLIKQINASDIFRSDHAGFYENSKWNLLKQENTSVSFHSIDTHTLFSLQQLPFSLAELPASFTKFKHAVNDIEISKPLAVLQDLPEPVDIQHWQTNALDALGPAGQFKGGESSALNHLALYFDSEKPASYKQVRNALDGWDNSTKLSPWLANGCLSVRQVRWVLADYEKNRVANESTYWIYFELLWREYFQWYAHKNGANLFSFSGIKHSPLTSYYPERFQKWVNGSTPYAIVNACMNQLRQTGYLSNRGRQIVASCFVNELAMDWRYGAAYFEQILIDYDVGSNWGNWQYLAGVGADTRDKRHFNLDKQAQQFDPQNRYIRRWNGDENLPKLDSIDAAGWPIL